jgi:signal transduction histidine kinase
MWSVREAFLLIFVVVVAAPLGLFWIWPHAVGAIDEAREIEERHGVLARQAASSLQRYHQRLVSTVDEIAATLMAGGRPDPNRARLDDMRLTRVRLVDAATGAVTHDTAHTGKGRPSALDPTFHQRLLAASRRGASAMTGVLAGPAGRPQQHIVRHEGNLLIVGSFDTDYLVEVARSIRFGKTGQALIIDATGRVLAHPSSALELEMRSLADNPGVQRVMAAGTGASRFAFDGASGDQGVGFATVPGAHWHVMVVQAMAEIMEREREFHRSSLVVFAMGLIIAALVALRASILIVEPVQRLIAATARLHQGDTPLAASVSSRYVPREFAELARNFDSMALAITEARTAEAAARRRAEHSNERKSEVMRYVTHELRSPVNAILGFAQLLVQGRHGPLGSPAYEAYARDLHGGAKHLLALINDLLDLSRIEAGKYELTETLVDIDEIVERAVRFAATGAEDRGMRIDVRYERGRPTVRGDERALFQSVLNLVTNSVRYGIEFGEIVLVSRLRNDGAVELAVIDNGPGIAPEDLEKVLEPFQRINAPRTQEVQGSGLGLPIVKRLIELHGGAFTLESELGVGTTARIVLPAGRVVEVDGETHRAIVSKAA